MPKNRQYLDLITKNTSMKNLSNMKFSVEDALADLMNPDYTLGEFNKPINSDFILANRGRMYAAGKTPYGLAPTVPEKTVKTRQQMSDELLPIDKSSKVYGGEGMKKVADATKTGSKKMFNDFTAGDIIGITSMLGGAIGEVMNTVSAAKATEKPVNRYLGFNEKALRVNKNAQMQSEMNENVSKREAERKIRLKSNTLKSRLRGGSTSLSGLKATDLATDYQSGEAQISSNNQLEEVYGKQMLELLGQEQQLLSQQDQAVMSAQERVDEKVQQNRDNYYTNLATNIAGLSEAGQKFGQDFNMSKYRQDFLNILPMTNKWGIGIGYENGVPEMYSTKRNRTITEEKVG